MGFGFAAIFVLLGWFGVVARLRSGVAAVEVSVCVLSSLAVVGDVGCFLVFSWVL